MRIDVEIPTPKNCVDCKFNTISTEGRYGKWMMGCMLLDKIHMEVREGLKMRHPDCPGVVIEEEKEP